MQHEIYVSGSFSMKMFPLSEEGTAFNIRTMTGEEVKAYLKGEDGTLRPNVKFSFRNAILANIVSDIVDHKIKPNHDNISLGESDVLIFANYRGSRIPEGATKLPKGTALHWYKIETISHD